MNKEESGLIARIKSGDQEAYGTLVDRYQKGLYFHCFNIVKDEETAKDIAQETFVACYRQLHRYDSKHRFSTWLYTIATRRAIDCLRAQKHLTKDGEEQLEKQESTALSPDQYACYGELYDAVHALPARYRDIVSAHFWEGKDYQTIAREMNIPVGSVKGWMSRAKAILRKELS